MSVFVLTYQPNRWRQRGSQLYQWVGRMLDSQRLLLAEVICQPETEKPFVGHVGIYAPRANAKEESWDLVYEIPPAAITVVPATSQ